jgi:hypothetical protein
MNDKSKTIETYGIPVERGALLCPSCGGNYLHHAGVAVYDRSEDAKQTIKTMVASGLVASHLIPSGESDNPSDRRDGIVISFWCELCHANPIELRFAQHRGATLASWRYTTHPELNGTDGSARPFPVFSDEARRRACSMTEAEFLAKFERDFPAGGG